MKPVGIEQLDDMARLLAVAGHGDTGGQGDIGVAPTVCVRCHDIVGAGQVVGQRRIDKDRADPAADGLIFVRDTGCHADIVGDLLRITRYGDGCDRGSRRDPEVMFQLKPPSGLTYHGHRPLYTRVDACKSPVNHQNAGRAWSPFLYEKRLPGQASHRLHTPLGDGRGER